MGSDAELMRRVIARDQSAFAEVYDRYAAGCLSLAARILTDRQVAEDVLQECFARLWAEPERFDPSRGSLRAWLFMTVRSRSLDRLRKHQVRSRVEETAKEEGPKFAKTPGRRSSTILMAMEGLPVNQRLIIELAYFDGLTQTEISEQLRMPLGTVKSRMRLAMGKLRDMFEEKRT